MFRKIAIALVATSVLAAPVLAQGTTLGDKVTTPSTTSIVPKSEDAKYGKYTRSMKHGRTASKFMSSARASVKPIPSKALGKRSFSKSKRGLQ